MSRAVRWEDGRMGGWEGMRERVRGREGECGRREGMRSGKHELPELSSRNGAVGM